MATEHTLEERKRTAQGMASICLSCLHPAPLPGQNVKPIDKWEKKRRQKWVKNVAKSWLDFEQFIPPDERCFWNKCPNTLELMALDYHGIKLMPVDKRYGWDSDRRYITWGGTGLYSWRIGDVIKEYAGGVYLVMEREILKPNKTAHFCFFGKIELIQTKKVVVDKSWRKVWDFYWDRGGRRAYEKMRQSILAKRRKNRAKKWAKGHP